MVRGNTKYIRFLSFIFLLLSAGSIYAQEAEVIAKSDFKPLKAGKSFAFLENNIDSSQLNHIVSYKVVSGKKKNSVTILFFDIKKDAKNRGANCFRLRSFEADSLSSLSFILDAYYADDSTLIQNEKSHFTNRVIVFCDDRKTDETYSLKVDDEKKEFKAGTYLDYSLKEDQEIKLSKGGLTGATVWIRYRKNKEPVFLTITSFGLGGDGYNPSGGVGLSFNTGRINQVDKDLGLLLMRLLTKSE